MRAATELELLRLLADLDVMLACPETTAELVVAPTTEAAGDAQKEADSEAGQWLADLQEFDAYRTDPYQLFGIPYDATDATIKSTFRKLSLKVHPDRCPGVSLNSCQGCV